MTKFGQKMKKQIFGLALLCQLPIVMATEVPFSLMQVVNFTINSEQLATAGLLKSEDIIALKKQGYQHVINLIPGDFSKEKQEVTNLEMTLDQIQVNWQAPTLQNFKDFTVLMDKYSKGKVLVHCQMNYRASTFTYLYLVTQKGMAYDVAKQNLLSVWKPQATWQKFIDDVKQNANRNAQIKHKNDDPKGTIVNINQ